MQRAEYALLGPELEHLAKQSVAGLLEDCQIWTGFNELRVYSRLGGQLHSREAV